MNQPRPQLMELDINLIEPDPAQVRQHFDQGAIDNLAASIRGQGQLIPILAYHDGERGVYVILDGERRWRAAKGQLATLKAEVLPFKPSPEETLLIQVSIDQQREALDPIEQSSAYRRLIEANQWSPTALAKMIHVSLSTVTRALSLLDLPEEMQGLVKARELPVGLARELARVEDPAVRSSAWAQVKQENLSQGATQKLISRLLKPAVKGKTRGPKPARKWQFKNLGGYNAVVTSKKVTLIASKKGTGVEDLLAAMKSLVERFEAEVAKLEAKTDLPANDFVADPIAQVAAHQ